MKFESKYGLGEICIYNEQNLKTERNHYKNELLAKVVQVVFEHGGETNYMVDLVLTNGAIQRILVPEAMLTGDPAFHPDTGYQVGSDDE